MGVPQAVQRDLRQMVLPYELIEPARKRVRAYRRTVKPRHYTLTAYPLVTEHFSLFLLPCPIVMQYVYQIVRQIDNAAGAVCFQAVRECSLFRNIQGIAVY